MAISSTTYKNLTIVVPEPLAGPGGRALNNNFKYIADQLQSLSANQLTKVSPATAGNLVQLKSSGLIKDTGVASSILDDVTNIPTAVDISKAGYFLINQGDGTTDWETVSSLGTNITVSSIDTETVVGDSIDDATAYSITWDYVIRNNASNGNLRAGTIKAVWEPVDASSSIVWYETHTNDIGDTSDVTFSVVINDTSDTVNLYITALSNNWDVKLFRKILRF